ncbi:unnamed protein product [Gongylonema pulchrum]|uniref:Protein TEX261 n=1 Tax=Gongylonema pulchrum TaxID=637853 RepID=A0A183EDI9_9BILA|nr:unnamed protein product [Gongylonema pulchrum]
MGVTVVEYTFWEAVCGASRVMLHANAIIFYYLVFHSLTNESAISTVQHFALIFAIAFLLYIAFMCMIRPTLTVLLDHLCTFITLSCFGYGLTPIIRTLTDTISTDTIYAMSFILFLMSFIFHDYAMNAPMYGFIPLFFNQNLTLKKEKFGDF